MKGLAYREEKNGDNRDTENLGGSSNLKRGVSWVRGTGDSEDGRKAPALVHVQTSVRERGGSRGKHQNEESVSLVFWESRFKNMYRWGKGKAGDLKN